MARICIITPGSPGSGPRVVKEATSLAAHGHQVHVIYVRSPIVDRLTADAVAGAAWTYEQVDLSDRKVRGVWRSMQLLARRVFALTGAASAQAQSLVAMPLIARALKHKADLYIAHYVAALTAAAQAAARHRALYAFDAEDFHPGDLPDTPEHAFDNRLIRAIEAALLPGCAYVTAAAPGIAEAYQSEYGLSAPTVVLNVFARSRAAPAPTARGFAEPGPSVYWVSQTIGPDRGLECAVQAIALATTRPHLYLRGVLAEGFEETLIALAAARGVADRLHLLAPGLPSQMEGLAACYDVGLVAETGMTPNHRIALSNKQFTYFLAGLPAVLSDTPGHRSFAALAPGAARVYRTEDPGALARALDAFLGDAEGLAAARAEAFRLGQERFNWDVEQAKLLECVDSALANSPSASRGDG
ncbi:MAG: hypothetical protein JWL79_3889 [Frankiales bacterium]|nr:hypothetical protein [Frankiales bacterium]